MVAEVTFGHCRRTGRQRVDFRWLRHWQYQGTQYAVLACQILAAFSFLVISTAISFLGAWSVGAESRLIEYVCRFRIQHGWDYDGRLVRGGRYIRVFEVRKSCSNFECFFIEVFETVDDDVLIVNPVADDDEPIVEETSPPLIQPDPPARRRRSGTNGTGSTTPDSGSIFSHLIFFQYGVVHQFWCQLVICHEKFCINYKSLMICYNPWIREKLLFLFHSMHQKHMILFNTIDFYAVCQKFSFEDPTVS